MPIDLSNQAGFKLQLITEDEQVSTGDEVTFRRVQRSIDELRDFLRDPEAQAHRSTAYLLFYPHRFDKTVEQQFKEDHLTYSLVLMPPMVIGEEYIKTTGHFHPPMPGTQLGYPEVYTGLYGELQLLLQERDMSDPGAVKDVKLFHLTAGRTLTIPPNFAHVLINTSDQPALMAGLYSTKFKPDYAPARSHRGLAYYLLQDDNGYTLQKNPRYGSVPPLDPLQELEDTPFFYPAEGTPLWTAYLQNPDDFAYIRDPLAAVARFGATA